MQFLRNETVRINKNNAKNYVCIQAVKRYKSAEYKKCKSKISFPTNVQLTENKRPLLRLEINSWAL